MLRFTGALGGGKKEELKTGNPAAATGSPCGQVSIDTEPSTFGLTCFKGQTKRTDQ